MFRESRWLLAALPLLAAAWALAAYASTRRGALLEALGRAASLARCSDAESERRPTRELLRLAACALILLALAGPQWGVELVETRGAARQVVVAVDVSLSMLAQDAKPSRLERAKSALSLLIEQLAGDRIGVVAFAGEAQIVCPITSDSAAAKELLGAIEIGAVPVPGSAVGAAIRTAAAMLGRYPGGKAVVLITDGEDKNSDPVGAAREAAAAGVRVYALGVGGPEGEPIPLDGGGYKKDAKGGAVVSRLDEATLSAVASASGGAYFRAGPTGDEIADVVERIKSLDRAEGLSGTASRWKNRYAWPLAAAFLLLLAELLLPLLPRERSAASRAKTAAFVAALAFVFLAPAPARSAPWAEAALREGNRRYADEKYEEALQSYAEASAKRPADPRPVFNAGNALYRLEQGDEASAAFAAVAGREDIPVGPRAAAWYNLGNARYQMGDYSGAVQSYRRALALAPGDGDSRHNLAIALRRLRNPPPPDKNKKDKKDPKKDEPKDPKQDPSGGGGGNPPPPSARNRPQDALSREDAERVMRAVEDRQKAAQKRAAEARRAAPRPTAPGGQDW